MLLRQNKLVVIIAQTTEIRAASISTKDCWLINSAVRVAAARGFSSLYDDAGDTDAASCHCYMFLSRKHLHCMCIVCVCVMCLSHIAHCKHCSALHTYTYVPLQITTFITSMCVLEESGFNSSSNACTIYSTAIYPISLHGLMRAWVHCLRFEDPLWLAQRYSALETYTTP